MSPSATLLATLLALLATGLELGALLELGATLELGALLELGAMLLELGGVLLGWEDELSEPKV